MTPAEHEEALVAKVKEQLDQSVEKLDSEVVARLRSARYEALHSQPQRTPWLWPVSGLATACSALLVALLWWGSPLEQAPPETAQIIEDVEVLIADDPLDLYENLEFYGWLAEQEHAS